MTELDMQTDGLTILEIVGEQELPCDLGQRQDEACPRPAKWIMFRKPCCPATATPALACTSCKDHRLMNRIGVVCRACGHIHPDAAEAYARIEAL